MGNYNSANFQQSVVNSIFQATSQTCVATCTATQSGNNVIIDGTVIGGNVNVFAATCSASATCIMDQQLDSSVSNAIESAIQQSNTSAGDFFDTTFQNNDTTVKQNITNSIT